MSFKSRLQNCSTKTDYLDDKISRCSSVKIPKKLILKPKCIRQRQEEQPSFSQISRREVMIKNLLTGISYTQTQNSAISECIETVALIKHSSTLSKDNTSNKTKTGNLIYLDALNNITKREHLGHPLFGNGDDSPIRIHLQINGVKEEFQFYPAPLLTSPSYNSLIHSGFCQKGPSRKLLDDSKKDLLSFMLTGEEKINNANQKIRLIKNNSAHLDLLKPKNIREQRVPTTVDILRKYIRRFLPITN